MWGLPEPSQAEEEEDSVERGERRERELVEALVRSQRKEAKYRQELEEARAQLELLRQELVQALPATERTVPPRRRAEESRSSAIDLPEPGPAHLHQRL